jgi:ABC transporter substrate binding protein (PQQ-dependent alcohol dehydrogenase system)
MKLILASIAISAVTSLICLGAYGAGIDVKIGYLRLEEKPHAVLSGLDPIPVENGIDGAKVALRDIQTTGAFLGQKFQLFVQSIPHDGDIVAAARAVFSQTDLVLLDMNGPALVKVADMAQSQNALLFNVSATDENLRSSECRPNLLHTALEASMNADALMQVLLSKRWTKLALIIGPTTQDQALADAYTTAAKKFGLKIVSEKKWTFDTDLRRAAAREVPLFTQKFKTHDVVLVADAHDDFARYIEHNTWAPRPVAGASGLRAVSWAPVMEQWGATQLQSRFSDATQRSMRPRVLSNDFELAAFQGRPLSYRSWNGQLRQPVPVVNAHAQVASAPLEGFEHQFNPLDTLGTDIAQSDCTAFGD